MSTPTPLTLQQLMPEFTKSYRGIHPFGQNTYLLPMAVQSREAKAKLAAALGLDDSYRSECLPESNLPARFECSIKLITEILPKAVLEDITAADGGNLLENRMKDGRKISRILTALFADQPDLRAKLVYLALKDSKKLLNELPKLKPVSNVEQLDSYPDQFVQNFYSEVAASRSQVYGFSLNFFDILRAAHTENISSCFSRTGCNSRGPFHLAMSPMAGVVYSKKNGDITGRAWAFFHPELHTFLVMKPYGFMDESLITGICNWLAASLDAGNTWGYQTDLRGVDSYANFTYWYGTTGSTGSMTHGGAWVDGTAAALYWNPAKGGAKELSKFMFVGSNGTPCPICGKNHVGSSLMCATCRNSVNSCPRCAKATIPNGMDGGVCLECASERKTLVKDSRSCDVCGGILQPNGLCLACFYKQRCSHCGATRPVTKVGSLRLCDQCINALTHGRCEVCEVVGPTYPHLGNALCFSCFSAAINAKSATTLSSSIGYSENTLGEWGRKLAEYLRENGILTPSTVDPAFSTTAKVVKGKLKIITGHGKR